MFPEMAHDRTITTDQILVEFAGDLRSVVTELSRLERGFARTYPPSDDPWWDTSYALEEYRHLIQRLNKRAPEGFYFGGHPDQPQCLGYWQMC